MSSGEAWPRVTSASEDGLNGSHGEGDVIIAEHESAEGAATFGDLGGPCRLLLAGRRRGHERLAKERLLYLQLY
jgi:hypothetical protein